MDYFKIRKEVEKKPTGK